jgi:hypothetical protein
MIMEGAEALGYVAAALVVASSSMRMMVPLRVLAIASNLTFVAYGLAAGLLPIILVHSILASINSFRLWQLLRLVRSVARAARADLALDGLLPFMTARRFRAGETLFRKSDPASEMFYVLSGEIRLPEVDRTIGAGSVLGEISMFSTHRDRSRRRRRRAADAQRGPGASALFPEPDLRVPPGPADHRKTDRELRDARGAPRPHARRRRPARAGGVAAGCRP